MLGGEEVSSELSQSTIRVRSDARGRVRRDAAIACTWRTVRAGNAGPDPSYRGQSLWTALTLPGHGRESLVVYIAEASLSQVAAACLVGWYVLREVQMAHSTPVSLRASGTVETSR